MQQKIGEYLKIRRKSLNLSVKDVVTTLNEFNVNISDKTLYGWENNHRQPDADTFLILCKIYKIENVLQYFGFSSESENIMSPLTREDEKLIKKYHDLDDRGKEAVLDTLEREHKHVEPKIKESAM